MTILEIESLFKTFGPVKALNDVSLSVEEGETMAIVGQNGAGKSTLVKILTGAYQKSSGQIRLEGKDVTISSPQVAKRLGIAEVYQQAELIPEFTVAENVVIGYPEYSSKGFVNRRRLEKAVQEMLDRYQIPLRAEQKVGELSAALRQLVAIMKVLFGRPKVLIWDEPTAVLSDREVEILFRIIKELKQLHVTMIYISHRLEEIFQICDRVAVMRDGQLITVLRNEGLTKEQLIHHMLGHEMDQMYAEKRYEPNDMVVLEADGITTSKVTDVSFKLHKGEILGFAGLVNSGRTETARALYGLDKLKKGSIKLGGKPVHIRRSTDAAKAGLFLAPEDRKREALVLCRSIRENISLSNLGAISRFGFCRRKDERRKVADFCKRLNVKMGSADDAAGTLSGGNQQKVVIAKAIMAEPGILIFDEPTQGIRMRFIDKDRQLVDRLNAAGSFEIRYFGTDKTTRVEGYTAHTWEDADLSGDELIFVSVCSQNLADVGRELKKRLDPEREHYIITCENATDPARILREQLDSERVHISEATVFCTTVEAGGCDIGSEEYPWLQYDVESLGGFRPEIPGLKPVRNFSAFLKRKLYTYNAASCVIAYLGWLKGCTDYAEAANDEVIGRLLDENYAETNAAVCREYGYDMADQQEFARLSKAKFCNRKIADTLERNARQPERKITRDERVIAPLLLIAKYGGDPRVLEMTAAAMLLYDGEGEEAWRTKVRDLGPAGVLREVCGLGDEPALCEGILGYYELFTADKRANANLLDSLSRKKAELPPAHPA